MFKLEANYFTILHWFLPYIDMNQPWVYMCSPSWQLNFQTQIILLAQVDTNTYLYLSIYLSIRICTVLSCSVMSNSLQPPGLHPPGFSVHEDSPGKNTGVGCHAILKGIFPTQESNPGLPYCRWILYHLSHQGSPIYMYDEGVNNPCSRIKHTQIHTHRENSKTEKTASGHCWKWINLCV